VTRVPFHASVLRPASQVGPMHKPLGTAGVTFYSPDNMPFLIPKQ